MNKHSQNFLLSSLMVYLEHPEIHFLKTAWLTFLWSQMDVEGVVVIESVNEIDSHLCFKF